MQGPNNPDYPIKVINLDRDVDRLARMTGWYDELGISFQRYPAVLGSELGNPARYFLLRHGRDAHGGTLGCALSHFGTWIEVAAGADEQVLILEDDAKPLEPLPSRFADLGIPADYDLCYVNERMVPKDQRERPQERRIVPLLDALKERSPGQRGHGADGYFLSRNGAKQLLNAFHVDRFLGHVDLQMLATGLSADDLAELVAAREGYGSVQRINKRRATTHACRMFVMIPALVTQSDEGLSSRRLRPEPQD